MESGRFSISSRISRRSADEITVQIDRGCMVDQQEAAGWPTNNQQMMLHPHPPTHRHKREIYDFYHSNGWMTVKIIRMGTVGKKSGPSAAVLSILLLLPLLIHLLLFPIFPWAIVVAWLVLKCRLVVFVSSSSLSSLTSCSSSILGTPFSGDPLNMWNE